MKFKVLFSQESHAQKTECEVEDGEKLTAAAHRAGVEIKQSCAGKATCTDCRVKVLSGMENLSPPTDAEKRAMGNVFHITHLRLSCQCYVKGPCEILVPKIDHKRKR